MSDSISFARDLKGHFDTLQKVIRSSIATLEAAKKTQQPRTVDARVRSSVALRVPGAAESSRHQIAVNDFIPHIVCASYGFTKALACKEAAFADLKERALLIEGLCGDGFRTTRNRLIELVGDTDQQPRWGSGAFSRRSSVEYELVEIESWLNHFQRTDIRERILGNQFSADLHKPEVMAAEDYVRSCQRVLGLAGPEKHVDGCRDLYEIHQAKSGQHGLNTERQIFDGLGLFLATERLVEIESAAKALAAVHAIEEPADQFSDVREFAGSTLKGKQRTTLEALIKAGGRCSVSDLSIEAGTTSTSPQKWWTDTSRQIGQKLEKAELPWMLGTHDSVATLEPLPAKK